VLLGDESPQAVEVDGGHEVGVALVVEVPHADLTEVTRMAVERENGPVVSISNGEMMGIEWRSKWRGRYALFVEVDPVVVLTTSVTTTTRMLPVLANTTVTGGNVSPLLSVLAQAGGL
jgi:hypothetical protein